MVQHELTCINKYLIKYLRNIYYANSPHTKAASVLAQFPIDVVLLGLATLPGLALRIRVAMGIEEVLQLGGYQLLLEHALVLGMGDLHDALAVQVRLTVAQMLFDAGRDQQDVAVTGQGQEEAVQHAHQRVRDLGALVEQGFAKG